MNFSAVILAGGRSSRMGRDKAWLPLDGQSLLARQIALVHELAPADIFISGRADTDYSSFGCPVLTDEFADAGPLAGIAAGLDAASVPLVLVLAVDMPDMTPDYLRSLAAQCSENSGVVPLRNDFYEGLAAIFPKAALPIAKKVLGDGDHSLQHFVRECIAGRLVKIVEVREEEAHLFNSLNEPSDLPGAK